MATHSSRCDASSDMGSRARGDGISAMDAIPPRYRSAELLVPEPGSGRKLHISRMCRTEGNPGASFCRCPRAQAIWARIISHRESKPHKPGHLLDWHCANRSVPRISPQVTAMLLSRYPMTSINSPQPGGRYGRSQGPSSSQCSGNTAWTAHITMRMYRCKPVKP